MLTQAEQRLVNSDSSTAGFDTLLDTEKTKKFFQSQLIDCEVSSISRQYLRYKPQTNCLAKYELHTNKGNFIAYAKTFGIDAKLKITKIFEKEVRHKIISNKVLIDADLGIVANLFPNDLKLKSIGMLWDADRQTKLFKNLFSDGLDYGNLGIELLAYKPERRLACKIESEDADKRLIKFHSPSRFVDVVAKNILLTNISEVRTHRCLSYSDKYKALSFSWIDGDNLYDRIEKESFSPDIIIELGKSIAKLHSTVTSIALPRSTESDVISRINSLSDTLLYLVPSRLKQLNQLRATLCSLIISNSKNRVINHGDFHAKQVIVNNKHVSLIDWDNAQLDHPMADIGLFFAHLDVKVIRNQLNEEVVHNIKEWFTQGYNSICHQADYSNLNYYYAFGLLQLAHHPFRNLNQDWPTTTKIIIDRCCSILFLNTKNNNHKPISTSNLKTKDLILQSKEINSEHLEFSKDKLLDEAFVSNILNPYLKQHLQTKDDFRVSTATCIKERKNKRCVIDYQLEANDKIINATKLSYILKCRYKGVDKKAYAVTKALYEEGLNEQSQTLRVPKPLFIVPELNSWVQENIETSSTWALIDSPEGNDIAKKIANACFRLHSIDPFSEQTHNKQHEFNILEKQLNSLIIQQPFYKHRIKKILSACEEITEDINDDFSMGIHRDFHPDQVLIKDEIVYLIDFDLYANGHPAVDLGNFLAHLEEWSLRTTGSSHHLEEQARAFTHEYMRLSNRQLLQETHLYKILSLARLIAVSMRIPSRTKNVPNLMTLVEQYLNLKPTSYNNTLIAIK